MRMIVYNVLVLQNEGEDLRGTMWIGLVVIAIGLVLLLEQLGVIEGGLAKFWPVLLIAFGAGLIFNSIKSKK